MVIRHGDIRALAADCRNAGRSQSKANVTKVEIDGDRFCDPGLGSHCGGDVLSGAYVDGAASLIRQHTWAVPKRSSLSIAVMAS